MPARCLTHPDTRYLLQCRAAALRAYPTLSERALWAELSGSKLGVAFRRQVVIPPFIVDFLAPRIKLGLVSVDGVAWDIRFGSFLDASPVQAPLREAWSSSLRLKSVGATGHLAVDCNERR